MSCHAQYAVLSLASRAASRCGCSCLGFPSVRAVHHDASDHVTGYRQWQHQQASLRQYAQQQQQWQTVLRDRHAGSVANTVHPPPYYNAPHAQYGQQQQQHQQQQLQLQQQQQQHHQQQQHQQQHHQQQLQLQQQQKQQLPQQQQQPQEATPSTSVKDSSVQAPVSTAWRDMARDLELHLIGSEDPLAALLVRARASAKETYLDVLALTLEEELTSHQAALLCCEACSVAMEMNGTNSTSVPLLFLEFVEHNATGLSGVIGMMIRALSDSLTGIENPNLISKREEAVASIHEQLRPILHQIPAEQLISLAMVSATSPAFLHEVALNLSPQLETIEPTWLTYLVALLVRYANPSHVTGVQSLPASQQSVPVPPIVPQFIEQAVRRFYSAPAMLTVEALGNITALLRDRLVPHAVELREMLEHSLASSHGIDLARSLSIAEAVVSQAVDEGPPSNQFLLNLNQRISESAKAASSDDLCRALRLLTSVSQCSPSIVDQMCEEAERRLSWLSVSNARDFLVFFAAAGVEDKVMYGALLSQYERMSAETPLDVNALLSVLASLSSLGSEAVEINEFMSWFLNDMMAAALQPLQPISTADDLGVLTDGVRSLGKFTTLTPTVITNTFELVLGFRAWDQVHGVDVLSTPLWCLHQCRQMASLTRCLQGLISDYHSQFAHFRPKLDINVLIACCDDLDECNLLSITVKTGVLKDVMGRMTAGHEQCSGPTLVTFARTFLRSSSPMRPGSHLERTCKLLLEQVALSDLSPLEILRVHQWTRAIPGSSGILSQTALPATFGGDMPLPQLIDEASRVEAEDLTSAFSSVFLRAVYDCRTDVTSALLPKLVEVLWKNMKSMAGCKELLESVLEDYVSRSAPKEVLEMFLRSPGIQRAAQDGAPLESITRVVRDESHAQLVLRNELIDVKLVMFLMEHDPVTNFILIKSYIDFLRRDPFLLRSIDLMDFPLLLKAVCMVDMVGSDSKKVNAVELQFVVPSLTLAIQLHGRHPLFLGNLMSVMTEKKYFPAQLVSSVSDALVDVFSVRHVHGVPPADAIAKFFLMSGVRDMKAIEAFFTFLATPHGSFYLRASDGPLFDFIGQLALPQGAALLEQVAQELGLTESCKSSNTYLQLVHALACLDSNLMLVVNLFSMVGNTSNLGAVEKMVRIGSVVSTSNLFSVPLDLGRYQVLLNLDFQKKYRGFLRRHETMERQIPASVLPVDKYLCHVCDFKHGCWFDAVLALDAAGNPLSFPQASPQRTNPSVIVDMDMLDVSHVDWPQGTAARVALLVVPDRKWWSSGEMFGDVRLQKRILERLGWMVQIMRPSFQQHGEAVRTQKIQNMLQFFQRAAYTTAGTGQHVRGVSAPLPPTSGGAPASDAQVAR